MKPSPFSIKPEEMQVSNQIDSELEQMSDIYRKKL
jgi:hypothetical protein